MVFQPKRTYTWGEGFKPNADANVVGAVCEQIENEYGSVTKERFLDAARAEDSPVHNLIEWNTDKAAELYRLDQAKNIIGCLRVTFVNAEKEEVAVKAFVNTSAISDKAQYESVEMVLKSEDKHAKYIERIKRELEAFVKRNAHIEELADILIEVAKSIAA